MKVPGSEVQDSKVQRSKDQGTKVVSLRRFRVEMRIDISYSLLVIG